MLRVLQIVKSIGRCKGAARALVPVRGRRQARALQALRHCKGLSFLAFPTKLSSSFYWSVPVMNCVCEGPAIGRLLSRPDCCDCSTEPRYSAVLLAARSCTSALIAMPQHQLQPPIQPSTACLIPTAASYQGLRQRQRLRCTPLCASSCFKLYALHCCRAPAAVQGLHQRIRYCS